MTLSPIIPPPFTFYSTLAAEPGPSSATEGVVAVVFTRGAKGEDKPPESNCCNKISLLLIKSLHILVMARGAEHQTKPCFHSATCTHQNHFLIGGSTSSALVLGLPIIIIIPNGSFRQPNCVEILWPIDASKATKSTTTSSSGCCSCCCYT